MKLEVFEIESGEPDKWQPVRGFVNPKGWLEWKDRDVSQCLRAIGTYPRETLFALLCVAKEEDISCDLEQEREFARMFNVAVNRLKDTGHVGEIDGNLIWKGPNE